MISAALQREAAGDFRNAPVEADQQPDASQVGIHDRASALAEGEPVLVMGGEKLLVVVDRDLALAIEHDAGIEDPPSGRIPFGDAAGDEDAVPARVRRHRGDEAAVRHGLGERAAMLGGIEQIAGVHAFRQHHQLSALAQRIVHELRRKLDVVLDVAEAGQGLGGGGTETLLLHWVLPLRGAGVRR